MEKRCRFSREMIVVVDNVNLENVVINFGLFFDSKLGDIISRPPHEESESDYIHQTLMVVSVSQMTKPRLTDNVSPLEITGASDDADKYVPLCSIAIKVLLTFTRFNNVTPRRNVI